MTDVREECECPKENQVGPGIIQELVVCLEEF